MATLEQHNEIVSRERDFAKLRLQQEKSNLKKYIRKRQKEFAGKFQEYIDRNSVDDQFLPSEDTLPLYEVVASTFRPLIKVYGVMPSYSAEELAVAFEFYKKVSIQINDTIKYIPKKEDFCALLDISTTTFANYLKDANDPEKRDVCQKVIDFCGARTADGALMGDVEKTYAIFHQRASNNLRDNDPIQQNNFIQSNTIVSDEQLKDLLDKFNNG